MIASLSGSVVIRRPDHVVVECAGVGYRLDVSSQTLKSVPAIGKSVQLLAQMVVREDSMTLYGFASEEERDLFNMLIAISGVGPKVAQAVLSGGNSRDLLSSIASGDAKRFQAAQGVGKKTAERIIVELREKVAGSLIETTITSASTQDPRILAREGLINLGYSLSEADSMLDGVATEAETTEELISAALRRVQSIDKV